LRLSDPTISPAEDEDFLVKIAGIERGKPPNTSDKIL